MRFEEKERKYYEAYEERYKTIHSKGFTWSSYLATPIVMNTIRKYGVKYKDNLLEIGCGEGRDSFAVLEAGFDLLATDISKEAISYCREKFPKYQSSFRIVDCLSEQMQSKYDFIYAIAVIHMFVLDADRKGFYQFIRNHLKEDGIALICTMGDGDFEMQSDIRTAFELQERNHESGKMLVAGTSCRMVSFSTFERELAENRLEIVEKGITSSSPDFGSLMYAIVKRGK